MSAQQDTSHGNPPAGRWKWIALLIAAFVILNAIITSEHWVPSCYWEWRRKRSMTFPRGGLVLDIVSNKPVAGARIIEIVKCEHAQTLAVTDAEGRFAIAVPSRWYDDGYHFNVEADQYTGTWVAGDGKDRLLSEFFNVFYQVDQKYKSHSGELPDDLVVFLIPEKEKHKLLTPEEHTRYMEDMEALEDLIRPMPSKNK